MRLDPRTKLLILAVTSVSVFMNKSIAVECVLAGISLALLSTSGNLKRMLKYAAFFLALLLIQLFIVPRLPVTFGGIVYMFAVYMEQSYIDSYVRYYTSPGWLAFILLFTTLMGFLGCMVGSRLIRRHFQKAGVL